MKFSRSFLSLLIALVFSGVIHGQKMTAEIVIAKHLDSISTAQVRKSLKNQVSTGVVDYRILRAGGAGASGKAAFASEGKKSLIAMTFPVPTYPAETIVYDGSKLKIAFVSGNVRSYIGDYLFKYDEIVKEGLIGGTLTTAWPLLDVAGSKAKVDYDGTKTIDGKEHHVLTYSKKGGTDVEVRLYFDSATFRHVRSEYRRVIASQIGSATLSSSGAGPLSAPSSQGSTGARAADASASQRQYKQVLTEEFGDFKEVSSINLPHSYKAHLLLEGTQGTREYEWKILFDQFFINQPLDPASFSTADR